MKIAMSSHEAAEMMSGLVDRVNNQIKTERAKAHQAGVVEGQRGNGSTAVLLANAMTTISELKAQNAEMAARESPNRTGPSDGQMQLHQAAEDIARLTRERDEARTISFDFQNRTGEANGRLREVYDLLMDAGKGNLVVAAREARVRLAAWIAT